MKNTIFFVLFLAASSLALPAFSVEVPHTFVAGERARASEVNENFQELGNAIDANTTAIQGNANDIAAVSGQANQNTADLDAIKAMPKRVKTLTLVDANGVLIGDGISDGDGIEFMFETDSGTIVGVRVNNNDEFHGRELYFLSPDCQGFPYLYSWDTGSLLPRRNFLSFAQVAVMQSDILVVDENAAPLDPALVQSVLGPVYGSDPSVEPGECSNDVGSLPPSSPENPGIYPAVVIGTIPDYARPFHYELR